MKRSEYKFGLTASEWQEAKDQIRLAIMDAAWDRQMTYYSHVADRVSVTEVDPYSGLINHLLGEIFDVSDFQRWWGSFCTVSVRTSRTARAEGAALEHLGVLGCLGVSGAVHTAGDYWDA